jgi:hypothetical protein
MAKTHNDPRDEYLARANQCRLKAQHAMSEAARGRYLDSAQRWMTLAMSYEQTPNLVSDSADPITFMPERAEAD